MSHSNIFALKSASADFTVRQKNVFDQLSALESGRNSTRTLEDDMNMDTEDNVDSHISNPRAQRSITKRLRGKESIFKKPQNPAPKNFINRIPDFKKHPHKWTRYSLDDVREEDMSDKSNTKAALSFLEELNQRNLSGNSLADDKVDLPRKILFKKQTKPIENKLVIEEDPNAIKPSFQSSKVIMPEYVVGKTVKKEKKKINVVVGKELKLDHLFDDE